MENNITYDGFVTPSLILVGSDTASKGMIIDKYAKTKDQDGLLCGYWSRGFEDGLIHIWLTKGTAAICNEREEWVNKRILLKEPISYMPFPEQEVEAPKTVKQKAAPLPKKRMVLDPVSKQFRLEI